MPVVVVDVDAQHAFERAAVEDQQPVDSARLRVRADQFTEPERRRARVQRLRIAPRRCSSFGAMRPGRRRSLRQGRRRPELPQRREHSELRSWAPSSVRTGPRISFSPPNPRGAAQLRRIVRRFPQKRRPSARAQGGARLRVARANLSGPTREGCPKSDRTRRRATGP
jgi:hypothetical protein